MSQALETIQRILDAEEFGSVVTFVDGPALGEKVVLDASGAVITGSFPEEIASDVVEDAKTLMDHEQHRAMGYGDHSVFIAYAPADDPQVAVGVIVENAGFGSTTAAPIASLMIEQYLRGEIMRSHAVSAVRARSSARDRGAG